MVTHATREAVEAELLRAQDELEELAEVCHCGIFRATRRGELRVVNPELARMLGYESAEELVGRNLVSDIVADPKEFIRLIQRSRRKREFRNAQMSWRRKDGSEVLVWISGELLLDTEGRFCWLEGEIEEISEQARDWSDAEVVFTAHGLLECFLQKWVVIVGHSELLLRKGALGSKDRERAETILRAATKARTVIRQAMRRHREQVEDKPLVSLNKWVERIATSAGPYLDPNVGWVNDLDPEVGMVRIREGQLFQMARILVPRSLAAMPRGGTLTVRTRRTDGRANWQPGSYGAFAVVNTGESGTDVERKSRRGRRRATRHLEEKRNGGWLAEVEELVRANNGYVECGVVPGVGRSYEVFLPTARPEPEEKPPELSAESLPAGCETILVIEPDELALRLVPETLRSKGYEVLHAHSSADVRQVVDQHRGYIHLIVFNPLAGDAVSETFGRLDGRQPRPPLLQLGRYWLATSEREDLVILEKPFLSWELVKKVQQLLAVGNTTSVVDLP